MTFMHGKPTNIRHIFVNKKCAVRKSIEHVPIDLPSAAAGYGLVNYEGSEIGISRWNFNRLMPTVKYFFTIYCRCVFVIIE